MDTRKPAQRRLYHQVSEVGHGGIPHEHCVGLVRLLAISNREPELLNAQFAAGQYAQACRKGDEGKTQFWLRMIGQAGYSLESESFN